MFSDVILLNFGVILQNVAVAKVILPPLSVHVHLSLLFIHRSFLFLCLSSLSLHLLPSLHFLLFFFLSLLISTLSNFFLMSLTLSPWVGSRSHFTEYTFPGERDWRETVTFLSFKEVMVMNISCSHV